MANANSKNCSFRRISLTKAILEINFLSASISAELGKTPTKWKTLACNLWFTNIDGSMNYTNIDYRIKQIILRTETTNSMYQHNVDYFLFDQPLQFEFEFWDENHANQVFNAEFYKEVAINFSMFTYDQNNLVINNLPRVLGSQFLTLTTVQPDAAIFCPANGYSQSGNIFSNSDSFRKLNEDMILEEFRRIAADRLECKPEQVRVKTKIINDYIEIGQGKTISLTELVDNDRTTAYIQRMNAVIYDFENGSSAVTITDNFKNQGNQVYISADGDTAPAATGYFASEIELYGNLTIQLIIYIAERLV